MVISLTPAQQAWIADHVAQGDFATMEQAARQLIDERIAERAAEASDDLVWAKPYVDEALNEVARGEVLTLEEHETNMKTLLSTLNRG